MRKVQYIRLLLFLLQVTVLYGIICVNLQLQQEMGMQRKNTGNQLSALLKSGSLLSILIIANVALWVLTLLFPLADYLYARPSGYAAAGWRTLFALSSDWGQLLRHPWTLVTYMFLHDGFWQIAFNILMLYFGGIMCCRYLGQKRFGWIYFLSGLFGALLYLLVYNIFPIGRMQASMLVGASAAVLGVFVAVAVYIPNQEVSLWLIQSFTVKIKYVAIAFVVIDLLSIPASNAGGHIAHIGGALFGWLYVLAMRANVSGWLKSKPFQKKESYAQRPSRPMSDDEYNRRRAQDQKRVDEILDKISQSGYENLTKEEKEFLFKYK